MKQYKNFSVLLKAAIDKKMQEAGVFHFWLECSKDHEEYTKSKEAFFESLDDITLNYLQGVKTQFPPDDESPSGSEAWVSLADKWVEFSLPTFKKATHLSSLQKCEDEIREIAHELQHGHENLAEEYADAMMCLFDSAKRVGISPAEIKEAFAEKMEVNFKRSWKKNDNNTYSHT